MIQIKYDLNGGTRRIVDPSELVGHYEVRVRREGSATYGTFNADEIRGMVEGATSIEAVRIPLVYRWEGIHGGHN